MEEEAIIALIEADIINQRLVDALKHFMKSDSDKHYLKLSDLLFDLLGLDDCPECEAAHMYYYIHSGVSIDRKITDESRFKRNGEYPWHFLKENTEKIQHRATFNIYQNPLAMKKIIIELIKCDLVNTRMINGLNRLDIEASSYRINITPVIFGLFGIKAEDRVDELYDRYLNLLTKYEPYDTLKGGLHSAATKIYASLNRITKSHTAAKFTEN